MRRSTVQLNVQSLSQASIRHNDQELPHVAFLIFDSAHESLCHQAIFVCSVLMPLVTVGDILDLTALNPFASVRRYELGAIPIERQEVIDAVAAGSKVESWAKKFILETK